ncbi:hypothetical protein QQX98_000665 [Neonectria punicea]|uniref:Uncharacterized protein n=1 Tax=Neonectria punicea TaxID=979145 RepID=A0ABR1HT70_9HYPO
MESDNKSLGLSLSEDVMSEKYSSPAFGPEVLVLDGQSIFSETAPATPLYQMSRSVTTLSLKSTSVLLERIENDLPGNAQGEARTTQRKPIFYLAHPLHAQYRTDTSSYYITSASPEMLGNVRLEISKPLLQKPGFQALLTPKKTASDSPLFNEEAQEPLFNAKPKWKGGKYKWTDADGKQVAIEEGKEDRHRLVITASMQTEMKDALVALWALRLWHDTAESSKSKREVLESMTPPSAVYPDTTLGKRAGALSGVAGGAC